MGNEGQNSIPKCRYMYLNTKNESMNTIGQSQRDRSKTGMDARRNMTAAGRRYLGKENVKKPTSKTFKTITAVNLFLICRSLKVNNPKRPINITDGAIKILRLGIKKFAATLAKPLTWKAKLSTNGGGFPVSNAPWYELMAALLIKWPV
ncbi:MAG: hypothetical protein A2669_01060 [Candidatus Yanofskybacteria bacterium RIFCSPHIGHO2_01_FULL_48_25b]|uniref:Uncharacterized protein n=1 Tax=Candidatus Yanofskybacteria bacterium RIFCSPHIGHO2_01_FULL_48_25b TaxID=1802672 RepID=A0A1F8F023_9BACT|nr:MAG: hypothetical protein A2669_01060 [Candidatus Yanofskybacteria bacterium RIFCSPHIGHO2_01_FULL_48_25b]